MYKLIVCDLDETLLNDAGDLTKGNIQAIQKAIKKGVYFVPNSGRSYTSYQDILEKLGLAGQKNTYAISYNGGLIIENQGNRPLADHGLDYDTAKAIYDIVVATNGSVHVYTANGGYLAHPSKWDLDYLNQRGVDYQILDNLAFSQFKDQLIMKVIVAFPDMADRQALKQTVTQKIQTPLTVTFSSDRYVEFNAAGVDKGRATLELAQKLGLSAAEVIAVGDNSNDLAMIQAAGLGVCVQNGLASVKAQAQYITQRTNNEDALAEVIDKFILK